MKPLEPIEAKEELKEILSNEEYQVYYREEQNTLLDLLDKINDWFSEKFTDLFPNLNIDGKTVEWLSYGVVALGLFLLALLVFILFSKFSREGKFHLRSLGNIKDFNMSSNQHINEADLLASKGDYRGAFRHLFLAFILYLEQSELIQVRPWKTNWEYYDELNNHNSEVAEFFYQIAIRFEEIIYGGKIANKEEFLAYRQQINDWFNHAGLKKDTTDFKGGL